MNNQSLGSCDRKVHNSPARLAQSNLPVEVALRFRGLGFRGLGFRV